MKVRLTNLAKGERSGFRLHGNGAEGYAAELPMVSRSFQMQGNALDSPHGIRCITTSAVIRINGEYFETVSGSRYRLEVLDG